MASTKVCVACGIDVSNIKRVKDPQGNYYCQICYDARLANRRARPTGDPEVDFECATCHRFFAVEDVFDESGVIICKSCFAGRTRPAKKAAPTQAAPPRVADNPPSAFDGEAVPPPHFDSPPPAAAPLGHAHEALDTLEVVDEAEEITAVWHLIDRGSKHGPLTDEELVGALREGRFTTAAQIWKDGMDGWKSILRVDSILGKQV